MLLFQFPFKALAITYYLDPLERKGGREGVFHGEHKVKQSKRGKERGFLGKRQKASAGHFLQVERWKLNFSADHGHALRAGCRVCSRLPVLDHGQAIHWLQHKRLPRPRGLQSPWPRPDHSKHSGLGSPQSNEHTGSAERAPHSSQCGGSHSCALREGAED